MGDGAGEDVIPHCTGTSCYNAAARINKRLDAREHSHAGTDCYDTDCATPAASEVVAWACRKHPKRTYPEGGFCHHVGPPWHESDDGPDFGTHCHEQMEPLTWADTQPAPAVDALVAAAEEAERLCRRLQQFPAEAVQPSYRRIADQLDAALAAFRQRGQGEK